MLVRAQDRGPAEQGGHPYNPRAELHGWTVSRMAGLQRVAVNLVWIPPGKEGAVFHVHHREEEWVFVLEGRGVVEVDDATYEVGAGDFVAFPPGVAHTVRNEATDQNLLLLEGGEVIRDVEVADFPRLGRRMVRMANRIAVYPLDAEVEFYPGMKELPPEVVAPLPAADRTKLLVRRGDRKTPRPYHHPQGTNSEVHLSWLSRPGLKRISVGVARVPAGRESFVKHVHRHDEEWMYILTGEGTLEVGERKARIGPGDFIGYPASGEPHSVRAETDLEYVLGGDAWSKDTIEIVDLPDHGIRKTFVGTRSAKSFPLTADVEDQH